MSVTVGFICIIDFMAVISPASFIGLAVFPIFVLQFTNTIKLYHVSKYRLSIIPT